MLRIVRSALAGIAAVSVSAAYAGGPVIIEEGNDEIIEEKPASKPGLLPLILIPLVLCAVMCGGDDDEPVDNGES